MLGIPIQSFLFGDLFADFSGAFLLFVSGSVSKNPHKLGSAQIRTNPQLLGTWLRQGFHAIFDQFQGTQGVLKRLARGKKRVKQWNLATSQQCNHHATIIYTTQIGIIDPKTQTCLINLPFFHPYDPQWCVIQCKSDLHPHGLVVLVQLRKDRTNIQMSTGNCDIIRLQRHLDQSKESYSNWSLAKLNS